MRIVLTDAQPPVITAVKEFGEIMQRAIPTTPYAVIVTNTAIPLVRIAEDWYITRMLCMRMVRIIPIAEIVLKS